MSLRQALNYRRWRAEGLCGQCGAVPAPGRKMCPFHIQKADRANEARKKRGPLPSEIRKAALVDARRDALAKRRAADRAAADQAKAIRDAAAIVAGRRPPSTRPQHECRWSLITQVETFTGGPVPVRSSWLIGTMAAP